ncbi:MAG: hypothetical protein MUP76_01865 [Acidimicrobiia bacterium]|nr:hypothetical protein [Acidimicrobiia bacterium]
MANTDDLAASIGRYLKKNEQVIGASRAAPRNGVRITSALAGIGAAAGYILSTFIGEGALAAAIGGGLGAAVGVSIATVVAYFRMRKILGIRAAVVTLALTPRRLLMFRQSWFANRVAELVREDPIEDITSIVVGKAKLISPHPVTIALGDGSALEFEAPKIEHPDLLAQAFRDTTGG